MTMTMHASDSFLSICLAHSSICLAAEIGERLGPFDLSLIPTGAYEPRWFMK